MSLEPSLIEYCSPTLASLKVGSLFSFISPCWEELFAEAARLTPMLREKGLNLRIAKVCETRALCYLYREEGLARVLMEPETADFLRRQGYRGQSTADALDTLFRRMVRAKDFPHEVGVFLGYPLSDVVAFIEHKGLGCTCCGCWKCYGDACEARRVFARYDKCTRVYRRLYRTGRTLNQLTVATRSTRDASFASTRA